MAAGKHPEVRAVGFLWCPSVPRVIFSSLLFKTAYFRFSFQGCPPPFSPNPQKISKSTLLFQFWSVFPVSQKPNVKAWHCGIWRARSTFAQSPFPVWPCPFWSHSQGSFVELRCLPDRLKCLTWVSCCFLYGWGWACFQDGWQPWGASQNPHCAFFTFP